MQTEHWTADKPQTKPTDLCCDTHTHIRLMALFPGLPRSAGTSEWQWHQLGLMQVCTLLQTDNHTSTPPLCFLQAGCPSCRPTNSVKALKAKSTKGTDLRCESTKIGGYHPHHHCYLLLLLSPLADTRTQLLIFTSHRVNGWVDLGTAVKVCHPHRCYLDRQGVLEWQNGSNINQTICKQYAPRSRQLTMPTPHQSLFMGHVLNNVTALHGNYLVSWPRLHISVLAHRRCVDAPFFRVRTQTWET